MVELTDAVVASPQAEDNMQFFEGATRMLGPMLDRLEANAVLLVRDDQAYESSGARAEVAPVLDGRCAAVLSGFAPNPKLEDVERGIGLFRDFKPDAIVAIGGGTAIDLAKLVGTIAVQEADPRLVATGDAVVERDGPPLLAVPTTAGTGSEATHFAVVYIDGVKHSLAHPLLRPDLVILDPLLTYAMPPGLTAATGLDALSQGIESLWAVGATTKSVGYAARAVELAAGALETAVIAPDRTARRAMMEAAHASGLAIDISKTTAPHALSYAISTEFGIAHGLAVALTLGAFLVFNGEVTESDCIDPRGAEHVRERIGRVCACLNAKSPDAARARLDAMLLAVGAPRRLGEAGVGAADVARLAGRVNIERLHNNPRAITEDELVELMGSIL